MSVSTGGLDDYQFHAGGWDFLDDNLIKLFDDILASELLSSTSYLVEIKSFCAMFVFIVLSIKAFKAVIGADYGIFNIVELGKPFMLCAVIINFPDFVKLLMASVGVFEDFYNDSLNAKILEVNLTMDKRFQLLQEVTESCLEKAQDLEETQTEEDSSTFGLLSGISDTFSELGDFISGILMLEWNKIMYMLVNFLEWLMLLLFQSAVYIIFFLRTVFCSLLAALGPIVFAISIFPAYEKLYQQWISRFVTTYFYGTIAFMSLRFSLSIIYAGTESEIRYLESVLQDPHFESIMLTQSTYWGGAYIMSIVLGLVTVVTVPVVAAWLMPTGGIGSAVSKFTGALIK